MWKLKAGKPFPPVGFTVEVFLKKDPMALDESRWGTQDFTLFFVEMIFRPFGDGQMSYPCRIPWKLLLVVSWLTSLGILAHVFIWILNDAFWRWVFSPYQGLPFETRLNCNELRGPKRKPCLKPEIDTSSSRTIIFGNYLSNFGGQKFAETSARGHTGPHCWWFRNLAKMINPDSQNGGS